MAWGAGKYDDEVTKVRTNVGISDDTGGGVLLIIFNGNQGSGFSCQTDLPTLMALPEILESIAKQIREDQHDSTSPGAVRSGLVE
jgi:hypothetical protein